MNYFNYYTQAAGVLSGLSPSPMSHNIFSNVSNIQQAMDRLMSAVPDISGFVGRLDEVVKRSTVVPPYITTDYANIIPSANISMPTFPSQLFGIPNMPNMAGVSNIPMDKIEFV